MDATAPHLCEIADMKDWTDLRILATIAREGSLAAAGRRLGIHHVTIGRRLTALEDELGVKLIDRLPRKAVPTKAGARIAELAGRIEEIVDSVNRVGRADRGRVSGTVSISAPPVAAVELIAPGLQPLLAAHPDLRVVIHSAAGLASLARGEADIAVRLVRPDQPGLVARRVSQIDLALYATREIAATSEEDWRFIGADGPLAQVPHHRWLESYAGDRPFILRTGDFFVQLAAACAGIGVAMLPTTTAAMRSELVVVDPGAAPPPRDAWLVVHPDLRRSAAVRVVLDHLAQILAVNSTFKNRL